MYSGLIICNILVAQHTAWSSRPVLFISVYEACFALCIWSHLACMLTDPGAVPPDLELTTGMQQCVKCCAPKPPRYHHCRTCKRCVMRMDHHCLFANNCIGAYNQKHFILFLVYLQPQLWTVAAGLPGSIKQDDWNAWQAACALIPLFATCAALFSCIHLTAQCVNVYSNQTYIELLKDTEREDRPLMYSLKELMGPGHWWLRFLPTPLQCSHLKEGI